MCIAYLFFQFMDTQTQNLRPNDQTTDKEQILPIIEEQAEVTKTDVKTGRVVFTKEVSQEDIDVQIPLTHHEVEVERVAINKYLEGSAPKVRYEGETMIIPVVREVAVVEKKLLLVEEVYVKPKQTQTEHQETVSVRKETLNIERS